MKKSLVKKVISLSLIFLPMTSSTLSAVSAQTTSDVVSVEITDEEEEAWQNEAGATESIKIAYNGGTCTGILGVAQAMGFFEEEGLTTEIIQVQNTSDALGTGQAHLGGGHISTNTIPIANGVNYSVVTGMHTGCKTLYVLNNEEINSTEDLVGQTVAIPEGVGSSDHNIAFRFFNNDGIEPEDVDYKQVESAAAIQALERGEVQGVILTDQFAWEFVENGVIKSIRSLSNDEDFENEACCANYVNNEFMEENPITTQKITRALQRTREWAAENPEEFVDTMLENDWTTGDRQVIIDYVKSLDYTVSDEATQQTLETIIGDYKEFGFISEDAGSNEEILDMMWSSQNN